MSGKVLSLPVSYVVSNGGSFFDINTGKIEKMPIGLRKSFKPEEGATYLMVFARHQKELLEIFESHYGKYIVYKSKPFTNDAHGNIKDDGARNTVVIWEL